jgi:hypothetical protein
MSGNIRIIGLIGSVILGSWVTVRTLAASPEPVLDDPPLSLVASQRPELQDASLAELIKRFATLAHAPHQAAR